MRRLRASIEDLMVRFGGWILTKLGWQVKGVVVYVDDIPLPVITMPHNERGDTFLLIPLRRD